MEDKQVVISAKNVGKHFKIYKDKPTTLKDRTLAIVKKSYEEFWAIKDVSLDIKKGEVVGLIGHNGCGKSTLLKLFTRIIYPEKGQISVIGQVSSLLELGAGFSPDFTGRENIYTNASIFGISKKEIDSIIDEIIKFSELKDFIDNPVRTYSSGMYMRLAFSVAIHVKPEVLLIDEILAVGDSNFQKKCMDKIVEFKKQGVTIVIVSHDLATIEKICDQVVWLDGGVIRKKGTPKKIINAYLEQMAKNQNEALVRHNEEEKEEESLEISTNEVEATEKSDDRWGSREIEIIDVELLKENEITAVYDVEDKMEIKIKYKVNKDVEDICFGVGIFGTDGVQRYGTNTHIDGEKVKLKKSGYVKFVIDRIGLVEGSYWLDVAAHDERGYPFDYRLKITEFATVSNIKDVGIVRLPHTWDFN